MSQKIYYNLGNSTLLLCRLVLFSWCLTRLAINAARIVLFKSTINPISVGGWNPPPPGFSLAIATNINRSTSNFLTFKFLLLRHNLTENQVYNLTGGQVITLLSEALCFTTYLSLYLHRIFRVYFFFFLTFILGVNRCFGGENILLVIFL